MHRSTLVVATVAVLAAAAGPVLAEQSKGPTVSVFIFEARVRSFAPAIEAAISLSEDQKKGLAQAYDEVSGTSAVRLASSVLQDMNASVAQRQMASATLLQAQASFRAKSQTILTDEQKALVDRVYEAFNRVYGQAQDELVKLITGNFAKELDKLLTPEQKQAMAKKQAELAAPTNGVSTRVELTGLRQYWQQGKDPGHPERVGHETEKEFDLNLDSVKLVPRGGGKTVEMVADRDAGLFWAKVPPGEYTITLSTHALNADGDSQKDAVRICTTQADTFLVVPMPMPTAKPLTVVVSCYVGLKRQDPVLTIVEPKATQMGTAIK